MAQIVDLQGNPISSQAIGEPQTARMSTLYRRWEEHPSKGLTPQRLHAILEQAERGDLQGQHDLFRDMEEKDGHILTEMGKRRQALTGCDWDIVPPTNASKSEKADAEWLHEVVESLELEEIILNAMDAIGHGFSGQELEWQRQGKETLPVALNSRPQNWFTISQEDHKTLLLNNAGFGEKLWDFGWLVHIHKAKSGYLARGGLHRTLCWPYLFKNYSVRDLAEFLEIYGLPMRVGKYMPGASDQEKATLLRAVTMIGHAAAGIIPEGMDIDFQNAAAGSHEPFEAMMNWCEKTESKVILGQTLTAQADGKTSTNALGNIHNEVRHDILRSDARQLARTLTRQLLWPIMAVNRPGADPRRCPRLMFDVVEAEDLAQYAEALPKLVESGMQVPVNWAHEKLRIPKPMDGEAVLGKQSGEDKPPKPAKDAAARYLAVLRNRAGELVPADQAAIDAFLDGLPGEQLNSAMTRALAPAITALRETADPEAAIAAMVASYPDMPDDELTDLLARAIFVADVWGRISGRT